MARKVLAVLLIVFGIFNELSGTMSYSAAASAVQQIGGLCFLILGTLQFILAYLLWPKAN